MRIMHHITNEDPHVSSALALARAQYDSDCGVVIEGFDHVCPWTGTGIGARNMNAFHTFVSCLCVCLIFDVLLLVGALKGV